MEFDSLSWTTSLKTPKCANCNNFLSCFPIYIFEKKDNICGRCYAAMSAMSDENVFVQNKAYENIAQCVRFPCRYEEEGCLKKLLPLDTPQHENLCPFRKITCPTSEFTQCTWQGALPKTYNHCQEKHFDIILKNGKFEFDLSQSYVCENLVEYNSLLFIVTRKYFSVNKCLSFSIYDVEPGRNKESFLCKIIFRHMTRDLVIQCSTTPFGEKKVTLIFLDSLTDPSNESATISAKISLEKVIGDPLLSNRKPLNEEMLSLLKCTTCHTYALPPIYQDNCQTTSAVKCSDCRAKPEHSLEKTTFRNINLDKVAYLLNYPCKNHEVGCNFVSKPDRMLHHQQFCSFGTHCCPVAEYVDCKWTGLGKGIWSHLREIHQNMIVVQNEKRIMHALGRVDSNLTPQFIKCYIIEFSDYFFLLNFAESSDSCFWTVQFLGEAPEKFMYELEIIDQTKNNRALLTRQRCTSLTTKSEMFSSLFDNSFCYFQKQQLQSFITNHSIHFNIKIFK